MVHPEITKKGTIWWKDTPYGHHTLAVPPGRELMTNPSKNSGYHTRRPQTKKPERNQKKHQRIHKSTKRRPKKPNRQRPIKRIGKQHETKKSVNRHGNGILGAFPAFPKKTFSHAEPHFLQAPVGTHQCGVWWILGHQGDRSR